MIVTETDSLVSSYDSPVTVDTVDMCATWNGRDYAVKSTLIGSSNRLNGELDDVRTDLYNGNGFLSSLTADGTPAAVPESIEPSLFEFLSVDSALRQASFDDPYYAVYTQRVSTSVPTTPQTSANRIPPTFFRHQLVRSGVRALVNTSQEVSRSPEGFRQFRAVVGAETVIRSIDPATQLLVREEFSGPSGRSLINHQWRSTAQGFLRTQTNIAATESLDGKSVRANTNIQFSNITMNGVQIR